MKKIIIVLPSFKAVSPVRAALTIIKNLYIEFSVKVVSIDSENSAQIDNISYNLKQLDIPCVYLNSQGMSKIFQASKELQQVVDDEEPDMIISYLLRADLVVSLLKTKAIKVASIRNMIEHEYRISHGRLIGNLFGFFHKRALRKFDKLIVMSQDMKDYFINNDFDKSKLSLIHNFLDEPDVIEKLNDNIDFSFENKFVTLVTISSLIKRKNITFIIENSLKLLNRGYKFNVLIIGNGEQKIDLEKMVSTSDYKDFFAFTGHIENPLPYLKMSDIFVMASLSEGVSRSLMEALYLGKTCIVSDIDGNRELIEHGINGYLFKNDDEFKKIIIENLQKNKESNPKNLLPYSFSYENGIKQTKRLLIEESK
uniref:glycosyltransferase n=1 Tax=Aliarcobacter sp. TaxID=2321116 RepID=UPI004047E8AE